MEKKDSPPPSRFPGASESPTDHSADQPGPSSPKSPRCDEPSLQESVPSGEDGSPTNSEALEKLRSLKDIYGDCRRDALKIRIKVPPGFNIHSPTTAKRRGDDGHGDSLKIRFKIPPGFDIGLLGALPSDSSPGNQETESSQPSLRCGEDSLKQEIVNDDYKTSLRGGIGGPVCSQPGPSCLRQPNRLIGPDEGPGGKDPGSASRSPKKPKNAQTLQSQEGHGGSDNPVVIGGPAGSRSMPVEPSQAAPERSADKPRGTSKRGEKKVRFKLPESGSRPPDKPSDRESENE